LEKFTTTDKEEEEEEEEEKEDDDNKEVEELRERNYQNLPQCHTSFFPPERKKEKESNQTDCNCSTQVFGRYLKRQYYTQDP
jgi:hypothetical protein